MILQESSLGDFGLVIEIHSISWPVLVQSVQKCFQK